jgi:hypothetical protein
VTSPSIKEVENFRRGAGDLEIELPSWIAKRILRDPSDVAILAEMSNFIVCNLQHVPAMLERILAAFAGSVNTISKAPSIDWR